MTFIEHLNTFWRGFRVIGGVLLGLAVLMWLSVNYAVTFWVLFITGLISVMSYGLGTDLEQ